jgi:L-alanine-DL-glutamate epimerase-like enolase superfamily enzyme
MDDDGMVHVPRDRPGIGVTVNMDRVDDLTVRQTVVDSSTRAAA